MNRQIIYLQKNNKSVVFADKIILPRSSRLLRNHSENFGWGDCGSGPAQLALALLMEFSGQRKFWCLQNYQQFKVDVIALLPDGDAQLPISVIKKWVADHLVKEGPGLKPI